VNFRLQNGESIGRNFHRLVGSQIENARACLEPKQRIADQQVHDARKSLKRARAALRLFQFAIAKTAFTGLNVTFRDAARPLTHARDAKVMLDTLASIQKYFGEAASCIPTDALQRKLKAQRTHTRRTVQGAARHLTTTRRLLQRALKDIERTRVQDDGWNTLGPAIRRIYRRGRDGMRESCIERSDEKLHEWRKRVKHLWHALQILEPLRPALLEELADHAHKLADLLGDDHDLAVLTQRVREEGADQKSNEALIVLIVTRRQALQERALALGERLFLDKPRRFESRLGNYWRRWRESQTTTIATTSAVMQIH
jgi:CHAD domain-containing protein